MGGKILLPALLAAISTAAQPADYRFEIARSSGVLYNPWTLGDDPVELRAFIGSGMKPGDFVAPTIRIVPGQKLRMISTTGWRRAAGALKQHPASTKPTSIPMACGSRLRGTATMC